MIRPFSVILEKEADPVADTIHDRVKEPIARRCEKTEPGNDLTVKY